MEKEHVPFDIAKALKELGFDEPCGGRFHNKRYEKNVLGNWYKHNSDEVAKKFLSAPLWQQAFAWFRNNHGIIGSTRSIRNFEVQDKYVWYYDSSIKIIGDEGMYERDHFPRIQLYRTFEEAQEACLRKMIEIVSDEE